MLLFFNGGFIFVSDYVRMKVTQIGASWDVVAGVQTGVDFIPMKLCGVPSCLALGVGALSMLAIFFCVSTLHGMVECAGRCI